MNTATYSKIKSFPIMPGKQKSLLATSPESIGNFAVWLAIELAPLVCGNKPATVLTFTNTRCRQLLTLWRQFAKDDDPLSPLIHCRSLIATPHRETVLFYVPPALAQCFDHPAHQDLLKNLGYPLQRGLEPCLQFLSHRFEERCPHEIGIILGIPLKDVLGFMGLSSLPLTCRGDWCVYGDPEESITRMQQHSRDRCHVSVLLHEGASPQELFDGNLYASDYTADSDQGFCH